jgi:hypothetical protein
MAAQWKATMDKEMVQLHDMGVYETAHLESIVGQSKDDEETTLLTSHFVFKVKTRDDGHGQAVFDKAKARLVAKGNQQSWGDYTESYAPVCQFDTMKIFLWLMLALGLMSCSIDFVGAYLNAYLKHKKLYSRFPTGYRQFDCNGMELCMHLIKGLYGLVQAGATWFQAISAWLLAYGFVILVSDPCAFILMQDSLIIILLLYVDDCAVFYNCATFKDKFMADLAKAFEIKQGPLEWFLGVNVIIGHEQIKLDARKCINDQLKSLNMTQASPKPTPGAVQPSLSDASQTPLPPDEATWYRKACGALQFIKIWRPDLAHAATARAKTMAKPTVQDKTALIRVWKYLKGTINAYVLTIHKDNSHLRTNSKYIKPHLHNLAIITTDANWQAPRSLSSFTVFIGSAALITKSKLQATIALSTFESETGALKLGVSTMLWIIGMMREVMAIVGKMSDKLPKLTPVPMLVDNKATVYMSQEFAIPTKSRHTLMQTGFILKAIKDKNGETFYISSEDNPSDIGTKDVEPKKFHAHASTLLGCAQVNINKVGPNGIYEN